MALRAFAGFRRNVVEEGGETRDIFKWLLMVVVEGGGLSGSKNVLFFSVA